MSKTNWIQGLNVGDHVYVHKHPIHGFDQEMITEITSEGILKTDFLDFNPDGTAICEKYLGFKPSLQEPTKEFLDKLDTARIARSLRKVADWRDFGVEKLRQIEKILESSED